MITKKKTIPLTCAGTPTVCGLTFTELVALAPVLSYLPAVGLRVLLEGDHVLVDNLRRMQIAHGQYLKRETSRLKVCVEDRAAIEIRAEHIKLPERTTLTSSTRL